MTDLSSALLDKMQATLVEMRGQMEAIEGRQELQRLSMKPRVRPTLRVLDGEARGTESIRPLLALVAGGTR